MMPPIFKDNLLTLSISINECPANGLHPRAEEQEHSVVLALADRRKSTINTRLSPIEDENYSIISGTILQGGA